MKGHCDSGRSSRRGGRDGHVASVAVGKYAGFMRPSLVRDHGLTEGQPMPLDVCTREFDSGATTLFGMDPQILSVGIIQMPGGYGFGVRRYQAPGVIPLRRLNANTIAKVGAIAVEIRNVPGPVRPLLELPSSAANGPTNTSTPEQARQRPLCLGSQLQNWDDDARAGLLNAERFVVGSLGFVLEREGGRLLVSNNHVLAGQNRGRLGDRIAQPGGARLDQTQVIARLERFVALEPSPTNARPRHGTVIWNHVDAAVARLSPGIDCDSGYVEARRLPTPRGFAGPVLNERVFKVGRTTGLRYGKIVGINERVGPIRYAVGNCWFRASFTIVGEDGQPFAEAGDSGAVVVRPSGELVGLIYASNGVDTYACPITEVLAQLEL